MEAQTTPDLTSLQGLAAAHPAVGDLSQLLERLRRRDRLTIGTERAQHAAALLARLAAQGVQLQDAATATAWLAPVLCVTAHDRRTLAERLQSIKPLPGTPLRELPPLPGEILSESGQRAARRRWLIWLVAAGLLVTAMLPLAFLGAPGGAGGQAAADAGGLATEGTLAWLLPVPAMLLFGLLALRGRVGGAVRATLPPAELQPTGMGFSWFDESELQGPLRLMGRQRRGLGRWLDLPETIRSTVRQAGWPQVVRGGRLRTPEHVLLVQLSGADDPQRLVAASVLDRLRKADLRVAAFTYIGAPDWLRPWERGPAVTLARLAAQMAGARLLVVSDGASFHDPFADAMREPEEFQRFAVRVLLSPVPQTAWSWREVALERGGWHLAEQSTQGVAALAAWLSGPREVMVALQPAPPGGPDFAALLAGDARMFMDEPPGPAVRAQLQDRLAQWLDPDPRQPPATLDLLRVLAVGTRLSPGAVERVAAHLATLGWPQPEEATLRRLLRLPWFGRGGMPAWLREDLLRGISPALAAAARHAWLLHLADRGPGKGDVSKEQDARLAAEAWRRLAHRASGADALMRGRLGLAERLPTSVDRRMVALNAGIAVGGAVALWLLLRYGPRLQPALQAVLTPVANLFALSDTPWPVLAAMACGAWTLPGFVPRWARHVLAGVAIYLALGGIWVGLLEVTDPRLWAGVLANSVVAGNFTATCGLVVLGYVRPLPRLSTGAHVAVLPGHPWLNALALYFMGTAVSYAAMGPGGDGIAERLGAHLMLAGMYALIGTALAFRLAASGLVVREERWRICARFAAAAAAATGMVAVFTPLVLTRYLPLAGARQGDLALAAGIVVTLASVARVPWWRVAAAVAAYAFCEAVWSASGAARWSQSGLVDMVLPARLLAVAVAVYRPGVPVAWRGVAAILAVNAAAMFVAYFFRSSETSMYGAISGWLLAWPLVRALRPDMVTPSDGLWWRCLMLPPCWIALSFGSSISIGGWPLLAIPLAGWIAGRHGARALPAIALALAPMAIQYHANVAGITVRLGGNPGHALAALLVARFVADRSFREACLTATVLEWWQIAALAILPLSYTSPTVMGLEIAPNTWPLALVVAGLIGLSRAPMNHAMAALAGGIICAFLASVTVGMPGSAELGRIVYGLRNLPGSLLTVLLVFALTRALRLGFRDNVKVEMPRRWLAESLQKQALAIGFVVAAVGYLMGITSAQRGWFGGETTLDFVPFFIIHYLLLTLFWAACGTRPASVEVAIGGWQVPWTLGLAFTVELIALLPAMTVGPGPAPGFVTLRLAGSGWFTAAANLLAVYAFHRMGEALRGMLDAAPIASGGLHPAFHTLPARIGIGLAGLAGVAMVALAVIAVAVPVAPAPGGVAPPATPQTQPYPAAN